MFSKLLVFGEMPVILGFSKLHGLLTCEGRGLSQSATWLHIGFAQGSGSLRSGCKASEEDTVEDKERMHVLGAVK